MANLAPLVINDGTTPTPVAHTFSVASNSGGKSMWADRSSTTLIGNALIRHEYKSPTNPNEAHRILVSFTKPIEYISDGVTKVDHVNSFTFAVNASQAASAQERKDLYAYLKNLINDASFKSSIENMEPFWS